MTVTAPDSDGYCDVSADAINDAVEEFNITIVSRLRFTDDITEVRQQTFENMKVTTRSKSSLLTIILVFLIFRFIHRTIVYSSIFILIIRG